MRFSTFQIMPHRPGVISHEVIQETLREIELSEQLGFDHVWLTEHHGTEYGLCASPSVLAAAVAMKTRRLGIGYAANVTPLHHPLRLAEQIALVDHLSQGRVLAGFGSGYSPYEFSLYGIDFSQRHLLHREILEMVLRAWTQEDFDYEGVGFHFKKAAISIKPYQQPHPPIVITASRPESIVEVARAGYRLMVLGTVEAIRSKVEIYRQALCQGNHPQAQGELCLQQIGALRHILVTQASDWNQQALEAATVWHVRMMGKLSSPANKPHHVDQDEVSEYVRGRVAAGSPEEVAAHIAALQTIGVGEVLCWFKWGEITHEQAVSSMKLFAEHVLPRFR